MKKDNFIIFFLIILVFPFCFFSCNDDDDNDDNSWQIENEQFFKGLASRTDLLKINAGSNNGFLYYKILKSGDSDQDSPTYTSTVEVHYTGVLISGFDVEADAIIAEKAFDTSYTDANFTGEKYNPVSFKLSGLIEGWWEALQRMNPGDKWRLYIPSELGYKDSGKGSIPGYSTLIFEVELVNIIK